MSRISSTRRQMLQAGGCGFGMLALRGLLAGQSGGHAHAATASHRDAALSIRGGDEQPLRPHFPPRAKRVIFLFMHGGPSQVDTFDYKPKLQQDDGGELPFERPENIDAIPKLMRSPWSFQQHGESGLWVSELFPHVAKQIDRLCILRSLHSRGQSHGQAVSMVHTGSDNLVRPSVGAWVSYGLGSENENLPAFIALGPPSGHGGPRNYGSAFLPASHQATTIGRAGKLGDGSIQFLHSSHSSRSTQQRQIELATNLNQNRLNRGGPDAEIEAAIASMELAYRMQIAAPDVLNLDHETEATRRMYGLDAGATDAYGRQCLLARRLVESGVRFVLVSTGNVWDQHSDLRGGHQRNAQAVDQPIAALLQDLDQRGLLDDTLVLWGGEFGRTPIVQGSNGRDHNPQGFTMWMAGGGIRGGLAYGNTDEYGYFAVEDRIHMHDLHATMLHQLGIDHERLTYRYAGRDFRLTDVYGRVVHDIID